MNKNISKILITVNTIVVLGMIGCIWKLNTNIDKLNTNIGNLNVQVKELRDDNYKLSNMNRSVNTEMYSLRNTVDRVLRTVENDSNRTSVIETRVESNVKEQKIEILTEQDIADYLKVKLEDIKPKLSFIKQVQINGKTRYLKSDVDYWISKLNSFEEGNVQNVMNSMEAAEYIGIPKKVLIEIIEGGYSKLLYIKSNNGYTFYRFEIDKWIKKFKISDPKDIEYYYQTTKSVMSPGELAKYLNIKIIEVFDYVKDENSGIPYKEVDGFIRFKLSEIKEWAKDKDFVLEYDALKSMNILALSDFLNIELGTIINLTKADENPIPYVVKDGTFLFERKEIIRWVQEIQK